MHPKLAEKKKFWTPVFGPKLGLFLSKTAFFSTKIQKKKDQKSKFSKNFIFLVFEGENLSFASQRRVVVAVAASPPPRRRANVVPSARRRRVAPLAARVRRDATLSEDVMAQRLPSYCGVGGERRV